MKEQEKKQAAEPTKRPYIVSGIGEDRLINASSQAQALRHAAKGTFTVKTANSGDVMRLMKAGVKVEEAGE